jgi:hypothetical protein
MLPIDRGYLGHDLIPTGDAAGAVIIFRPWPAPARAGPFSKRGFQLDLIAGQATGSTRKNTGHLRRVCAIQNLERVQALSQPAANVAEPVERLTA